MRSIREDLVIDIGGTNVKMLASGHEAPRKFPSGPELTPEQMVAGVLAATTDWDYEAVSIGFPGPILCGQPMTEPVNLGPGWMGFDFAAAFGRPVKVINDAAMQALGSYQGGKMLFLGLGTGLGAAVIMDGVLEPLEIGRFHYKKRTLEHYVGERGRKRQGRKKWQRQVEEVVARLVDGPQARRRGPRRRERQEARSRCRPGLGWATTAFAFLGDSACGKRTADTAALVPARPDGATQHGAGEPKPDATAPTTDIRPAEKPR